ncbi:MAG: alpha/beta hydrolase-fold protein [Bacteroidota bacterium]
MNSKIILYAALSVTLLFLACSKENVPDDDPNGENSEEPIKEIEEPIEEENGESRGADPDEGETGSYSFVKFDFTHQLTGQKIPVHYFEPKVLENSPEKFPLVLALHGAEYFLSADTTFLSGFEGEERSAYMALAWVKKKNQAKYPCYVVAPNLHQGLWQSGGNESYFGWQKEYPTDLVEKLLDSLLTHNAQIDENRVYLNGHSMGGDGTWYLGSKLRERFAAIVPLSSAFDSEDDIYQYVQSEVCKGNLKDLPVWSFIHSVDANSKRANKSDSEDGSRAMAGLMDELAGYDLVYTHRKGNVDNNLSKQEIFAKIEAGGKHFYTEYTYPCRSVGDCHFAQVYALQEDFLLRWLFQQHKN